VNEQRRGRRTAMTADERDRFLREARTCRVATVGADGSPHVTPLWFVWDGDSLWLTSIVQSQRWTDLQRDNRMSVIVDGGHDFLELRGVELKGRAEVVGEVPRTGEPSTALETPERLFADKYAGGQVRHDGRHGWLRLTPEKMVSWDFRKLAAS
jgi:PPOX class probable F420-dependent enzyme